MKEFFTKWNATASSLKTVDLANGIIEEYQADGYVLTLRQLYYQFVARALIENTERSYKNLGDTITKARLAGLISWNAIEDRNRSCHTFWTDENPMNPIEDMPRYIRFDQWGRQDTYMEVWVEKEALGNVVSRACDKWLVPHLSCKGYLSASAAYQAGKRFEQQYSDGKHCVLVHLGDHDPSGIDMTRDNDDRVQLLSNQAHVEVRRIALNKPQIRKYNPPPNPTKLKDSRAKKYIKQHGKTSWELDALEPKVIEELITGQIEGCLDMSLWNRTKKQESKVKKQLAQVGENWHDIKEFMKTLKE